MDDIGFGIADNFIIKERANDVFNVMELVIVAKAVCCFVLL
jgi:hypothetical protein